MNQFKQILLAVALSVSSLAYAGDVGMIDELDSDVVMVAGAQQDQASSGFYSSFVHVDGGRFYRQLVDNSGLLCLDADVSYGESCDASQSWTNGKRASLWGVGVGFRYNERFALDFSYWNLDTQKTALTADADETIALDTWMITALYQAQFEVMPQVWLMPQFGVAYVVNTAKGQVAEAGVHSRSINWRPAAGLVFLFKLTDRLAANVSGVYVAAAGRSPTRAMVYPATTLATAGLRYSF